MMRRTLRSTLVGTLATAVLAVSMGPAVAAPEQDQQIQNTMRSLVLAAQKASGTVTQDSLTQAIEAKEGVNAWERNVDFEVTGKHSSTFGSFSLFTAPDGTIGIATRSADGGCTMTTVKDGKTTTWSIGDVGKNCTGKSAVGGKNAEVPFLDPVPPAAPTELVPTPGDTEVELTWVAPADNDLKHYEVLVDGVGVGTVPAGTTTYTATGLTNYTEYTFTVRAVDVADNVSDVSAPVKATPVDLTAPAVPATLAVTPGDSQLDLSWGAAPDADLEGYRVYLDGQLHATVPAGTTTMNVPNLVNGTPYTFEVSSFDRNGNESARTEPVTGTPVDLTPPPVPAGVKVTSTTASSVALSWTGVVADDLSHYNVYVDGVLVGRTTGTGTTHTVTGLVSGKTYRLSVASVDRAGNVSARSIEVSATTVSDTTPPRTPSGLVLAAGDSQVKATWAANTEADLAGYRVYRNGVLVADVPAGTTTFTDTGLVNGTWYNYTVAAYDTSGNLSSRSWSSWAMPKDYVAPGAPTNLTGTVTGSETVALSWTAPADTDLRYYVVYVNGQLHAAAYGTTYNVSGLAPGATYTFTVAAFDTSGNLGSKSNEVTLETAPQQPGTSAVTGQAGYNAASTTTDDAGNIYVTGGRSGDTGLSTVRRFNVSTQTWETLPNMPVIRMYHTSGVDSKGRLFVFGGRKYMYLNQIPGACYSTCNPYYYPSAFVKDTHMYDPTTNTWTLVAKMPGEGHADGSTVVEDSQGRFTIIGGVVPNFGESGNCCYSNPEMNNISRFVERYDPATNTWTRPTALPGKSWYHASVVDSQDRVYVIGGGANWNNNYTHSNVYRLDPATNGWTKLASFPGSFGRWKMGAAVDKHDRVTIAGGQYVWTYGTNYQAQIEQFDPATNTWAGLGGIPLSASEPAVTADKDGNTWIFGGVSWSAVSGNITKVDGATSTVTQVGLLKQYRGGADAVATPDGALHVIGGWTYSNGKYEANGRLWWNYSYAIDATKAERFIPLG